MIHNIGMCAAAGLAGNPSDGCWGKAVGVPVWNFRAELTLYETPELAFVPSTTDASEFADFADLAENVESFGYYGGIRLLKATTKKFVEWCAMRGVELPERNFTVRYTSGIPRQCGLANTGAVCAGMLHGLMRFYEVDVPAAAAPVICWRAERDELGIPCGFLGRVTQTLEKPVFMDLDRERLEATDTVRVEPIPVESLPPLYVAVPEHHPPRSKDYHRRLSILHEEHRPRIMDAMDEFAEFATVMLEALRRRDYPEVKRVIDANFDLRATVLSMTGPEVEAARVARAHGASAKLSGGSGSIVGTYEDPAMLTKLADALSAIGYRAEAIQLAPRETGRTP